jgi:predicted dehydrogenase
MIESIAPVSDPVNVAVIGCGRWGPNHVRCLQAMPGVDVAVADLDGEALRRLSLEHPRLRTCTDPLALVRDPAFQAVVIATPTATHFELAEAALQARKHVLVEKPLCLSGIEAEKLIVLAHRQAATLMVGNVFLFNPGIVKIKELIDTDRLGPLRHLSAVRTNLGPIRSDVNAAYDLASHDISVFNWLLDGVPTSVSAEGGAYVQTGIHDVVFITLRYPGGVVANIHAGWLHPKKVRQMTFVGARRMVTWDDLDAVAPVAVYDSGAEAGSARDRPDGIELRSGAVGFPAVGLEEPLAAQDGHFIDAVRRNRSVRSDGLFSLGVVRTLEAVNRSLRRNGAPEPIAGAQLDVFRDSSVARSAARSADVASESASAVRAAESGS